MRMGAWRAKPVTRSRSSRRRSGARVKNWKGGSRRTKDSNGSKRIDGRAPWCAHEALPHTRPGGKPPETLAPFPRKGDGMGREPVCQGYAAPAKSAALDRPSLSPENTKLGTGKGGLWSGGRCRQSRQPQQSNQERCVLTKPAFSWKARRRGVKRRALEVRSERRGNRGTGGLSSTWVQGPALVFSAGAR
jgi:hypothetical protein